MRYTPSPSLSDEHDDGGLASRDAYREQDSFEERVGTAAEDSIYDARLRRPSFGAPRRASVLGDDRVAGKTPSFAKRMSRATARFFLAVLIGVGATLSWQSYGAEAQKMVVSRIPSLAWLVPPSATPSNTATAGATDSAQQLNPMALDIVAIQHQVAQLAASQGQLVAEQGQIARSVAAIAAAEQEVSQKISAIAEPKPVHLQPRKPAQRLAPSALAPEAQ
jgi:hypothetical protein